MSNFRPTDRQTGFLMPPSVDEWLPERHLARFVVEVVEGLDLRAMSGSYRGSGSASYHPRILLSLLSLPPTTTPSPRSGVGFLRQIQALFVDVLKLAPAEAGHGECEPAQRVVV